MTPKALRSIALAIAVAALVDPSVAVSGRARPRISVLVESARRSDAAKIVRRDLAAVLQSRFDVVDGMDGSAAHTIVVGDRYPETPVVGRVSTVSLTATPHAGPRITAIDAPRTVPAASSAHLVVDVEGASIKGTTSTLVVTAAGVEVGRVSHAWIGDSERWRAEIDVVPIGAPPFVFHAEVSPEADGRADVVVASEREPMRVLIYEPRPSWASTFVRRALESDARFLVSAVTDVSRGVAVRSGAAGTLPNIAFDDVDVALVGGLDALSAADASWLDRFMRERGGSVALVPDTRLANGPARALASDELSGTETLLEKAAPLITGLPLPRIDASELLIFKADGAEVVARASGSDGAVVVIEPKGDGELLLSGALDAWRFRADPGVHFDEFWRSAIAGLALAARASVTADVDPQILAPGATGRINIRVRRPLAAGPVSAHIANGEAIRLWPRATPGEFTGRFAAPLDVGAHAVRVAAGDRPEQSATVPFIVGKGEPRQPGGEPPLALLSASHGGVDVDERHLDALDAFLRAQVPASEARARRRPMRTAWWLVPFSVCLCGEWWLRRRNGLR